MRQRFWRLMAELKKLMAERRGDPTSGKPMNYQQSFFTLH